MTRRFEYVGGTSAKFWSVDVVGARVTVRWGRIGSDGQSQVKDFPSNYRASAFADKMIAEKLGKGYKEVGTVKLIPPAKPPSVHIPKVTNTPKPAPPPPPTAGQQLIRSMRHRAKRIITTDTDPEEAD